MVIDIIEVYAFRHPETFYNTMGLFQGRIDTPLNEVGLKQTEEIAVRLDSIPFTLILSSRLRRAHDFAEKVSQRHGLEVVTDDLLIERSLGRYESLPYDSHPGGRQAAVCSDDFEGGESLEQLFKRVSRIPQRLREYSDHSVIGLFSHGTLLATLPFALRGEPYDGNRAELIGNGACHYFRLTEDGSLDELRTINFLVS